MPIYNRPADPSRVHKLIITTLMQERHLTFAEAVQWFRDSPGGTRDKLKARAHRLLMEERRTALGNPTFAGREPLRQPGSRRA